MKCSKAAFGEQNKMWMIMNKMCKAKVALAFGNKIVLTADYVSIETTCASGCSLVRLSPSIGVMDGAHYRMSADILHPHSLTKLVGTL